MPDDRVRVREIVWQEVFPWLILLRAFRVSIQVQQVLLASGGILLTVGGWWSLASVFERGLPAGRAEPYKSCPWTSAELPRSQVQRLRDSISPPTADPAALHGQWNAPPPEFGSQPGDPYLGARWQLQAPFAQLFNWDMTYTELAFLLLCALWTAAVWGLFGGALTRRAALKLGREENLGVVPSLRYAGSKWISYFWAPLLPLIPVLVCTAGMALLGLLMRSNWGVVLAGLFWPLCLLVGIGMTMLLLVLFFGWPLMAPTISTELSDSFDALSRSWSYVFHRPLHYLFYAAMATALGWLGWVLASHFADAVAYLPVWAASWGTGEKRMREILNGSIEGMLGLWGHNLLWFWLGCVRLAALGFVYSYFWTVSTAIYLLLRRDDDGTEMDDVRVDAPRQTYGLPPLETDAAGVPLVAKDESTAANPAAADLGVAPAEAAAPPSEPPPAI